MMCFFVVSGDDIKDEAMGENERGEKDKVGDGSLMYLSPISFYFLLVLGIEPRALDILGKCSTAKLHPQPSTLSL